MQIGLARTISLLFSKPSAERLAFPGELAIYDPWIILQCKVFMSVDSICWSEEDKLILNNSTGFFSHCLDVDSIDNIDSIEK